MSERRTSKHTADKKTNQSLATIRMASDTRDCFAGATRPIKRTMLIAGNTL